MTNLLIFSFGVTHKSLPPPPTSLPHPHYIFLITNSAILILFLYPFAIHLQSKQIILQPLNSSSPLPLIKNRTICLFNKVVSFFPVTFQTENILVSCQANHKHSILLPINPWIWSLLWL